MDVLHLVPYAVGSVIGAITTLMTAAVLFNVYRQARVQEGRGAKATLYLALACTFWGANSVLVVFWYVLHTTWSAPLLLGQPILLSLALAFLTRFAYAFRGNPLSAREARTVFKAFGGYAGLVALYVGYQVLRYGDQYEVPLEVVELVYPAAVAWAISVFMRKWWATRERAHLYFAALNVLVFLPALTYIGMQQYLIPLKVHLYVNDSVLCLYPPTLAMMYIYWAEERLSVGVKLVGASLVTVLAVLGLAGLSFYDPAELQARSGIVAPDGEVLRFEPYDGGYRVLPQALPQRSYAAARTDPDGDLGQNLGLGDHDDVALPLGFAFPFYSHAYDTLYVSDNGFVTFGGVPCRAPTSRCFYRGQPTLAPLLADFAPNEGGGVFFERAPDSATVTWLDVPALESLGERATVQLVLYPSGAFAFRYPDVSMTLSEALRGVHPGGETMPVAADLSGSPIVLDAEEGFVEDYAVAYRRYAAHSVRWLYIAIGLFTLLIPILFLVIARISVLDPVRELQRAAEQINRHDFDIDLRRRRSRDQIGDLRGAFVRMADELKQYATRMEQLVEERTAEVDRQRERAEEQARRLEAATEELERKNQQLEETSAAKSQFLANVSHEFRSPLTVILGPLDDALKETNGAANGTAGRIPRPTLVTMKNQALHLLGRINKLLALAKVDAGHERLRARAVDLVPLLERLRADYAAFAERRRLTFHFVSDAEACPAYVDIEKLDTVVRNLLSNAFKFTPEGAQVLLSMGALPPDPQAPEGRVRIQVKNTGTQIPSDVQPFIFEPFYQGDATSTREHEGTGIGLALVKEYVELHGGTVGVECDPLATTFTITLPKGRGHLTDEQIAEGPGAAGGAADAAWEVLPEETDPPAGVAGPAAPEGAPTVLIAEDNETVRSYLRTTLRAHYRLVETADGAEAWKRARDVEPDLVLADVMMPKMDGLELCRRLKADPNLDHVPVLMLTALATPAEREKGFAAGADDYLFKPFDAHELHVRIRNLIEQRRRLARHFSRHITFLLGEDAVRIASEQVTFFRQVVDVVNAMIREVPFALTAKELEGRLHDEGLRQPDGTVEHVAERTVRRRIKDATGMGTGEFLSTMRLLYARQLIERHVQKGDPRHDLDLDVVAEQVGWRSYGAFREKYRVLFGLAPDEHAAMHRARRQLGAGLAAEVVAAAFGYEDEAAFFAAFRTAFPDWPVEAEKSAPSGTVEGADVP